MKEEFFTLVDINTELNQLVWTLRREQVDSIVNLMVNSNDNEMRDLGLSIGRAIRAISSKAGA